MAAARGEAPRIRAFRSPAGEQTDEQQEMFGKRGILGSGSASLFNGLALPMLPAHHPVSSSQQSVAEPLEKFCNH